MVESLDLWKRTRFGSSKRRTSMVESLDLWKRTRFGSLKRRTSMVVGSLETDPIWIFGSLDLRKRIRTSVAESLETEPIWILVGDLVAHDSPCSSSKKGATPVARI